MNRLYFKSMMMLAVMALMCTIANASPITREQAQQRAAQFLQRCPGSLLLTPVSQEAKLSPRRFARVAGGVTVSQPSTPLYYVFNRGTDEGFVIVSGLDSTLPVLGYTDHGSFDFPNLPPNMQAWLASYEDELSALSAAETAGNVPVAADVPVHDPVAPLCTTKWNQGSPYNLLCPDYFGRGRSVTGCVATAMAQVLYYNHAKSVQEVQADIPAYDTNTAHATYGRLHVEGIPAGSPIPWEDMIDVYNNNATIRQKMAVAQLMLYCGVAVRMDYSNSSSGAYSSDVPDAFRKYFGYGSSVKYIERDNYTEVNWDKAIYNELAHDRAVYLSGFNDSGGHAFVCDGYDGNHCFHINWGWGGGGPDGYYLISTLNPGSQGIGGSSGGYSEGLGAIIGIQLENYADAAISFSDATVKSAALSHFDTNGDGKLSHAEAAAVTDLGTVFAGLRIKNFPELYHFTGLTTLPDGAFENCSLLTSLRLPRQLKGIGKCAFKGCRALKTLELFDEVTSIGDDAFNGCSLLPLSELPKELINIGTRAMKGCATRQLILPQHVTTIGDSAFAACTKLTGVTVNMAVPQDVTMGTDLFAEVNTATATLKVVEGTTGFFAASAEWNTFAKTTEHRDITGGQFATAVTPDETYYLYHVATGQYLTRGEAYGTQAVVGSEPMRFRIGKTEDMPEDIYYLYSDDTGSNKHYLYRSYNDANVGRGMRAVFVNGSSAISSAWWNIRSVGNALFTLQTPENQTTYKEGQCLGLVPGRESGIAYPSYGVYNDIPYEGHERECQWRLVPYDPERAAHFAAAEALQNLLTRATDKGLTVTTEQAVYDNVESTIPELEAAQRHLRHKLGYVHFTDPVVRNICLETWDLDGDGELSDVEAHGIQNFGDAFAASEVEDFTEMQLFTGISVIDDQAFVRSTKLRCIVLPEGLTSIGQRAFYGCNKLEEVTMPAFITSISQWAFDNCKALKTVTISAPDPSDVQLGSNVFRGVDLTAVTLVVPRGSRERYAAAAQWEDFGTICEMRTETLPDFSPVKASKWGYLYNLGARKFLTHGEAYDTQAVVDEEGVPYQLRRVGSAATNNYTLYSDHTGRDNKTLFRTDSDGKVGKNVKACFVDGTVSAKAHWHLQAVEGMENVFTLQVPENDETYVEGEYLGIDPNHQTKVIHPTYGLYWDIPLSDHPANCYWAFITEEDMAAAQAFDVLAQQLRRLLSQAAAQQLDATAEQAVYDDFTSTAEQLTDAVKSLRRKLQLIDFQCDRAQKLCVDLWDQNEDDELSLPEAAAVKDIGLCFRNQSGIKSLEELRYFTSLTAIPDNAFRGCSSLLSIYLPEGVKSVGNYAFSSTSGLKYMAVLSADTMVPATEETGLPKTLNVFVPAALLDAYAADETWNRGQVLEYTGTPVVTADNAERLYARNNAKFTFTVTGAPINGAPSLTCEADVNSSVGEYGIYVAPGTITSERLQCINGVLTVNKAPATVVAKSYTRSVGEPNPEFEVTYRGFKNKDKAQDVVLVQPTIECDATADSPAGEYEIRVFGAEAQNYDFSYEAGTLTITPSDAVRDLSTLNSQLSTLFDLTGRRLTAPPSKGIYLKNGQKRVAK